MNKHLSLQAVYQDPAFSKFGNLCDGYLITDDGKEFKVVSELLSSKSEFFNSNFSRNEETGECKAVVPRIRPDILENILIYMYTGRIQLNTENMIDLLVASDFLMINSLANKCKKFVLENKTLGNIVSLFLTAYGNKRLDVEDQCRRFLLLCFEKAVEHSENEAYCLPFEALKYFLSHRSINVSGERYLWSFIESWVQKDPTNRLLNVPELLRFICLNEIDDNLASDIVSSPIILNNKMYGDLEDPDKTPVASCDRRRLETVIRHRNDVPVFPGARLPPCLHIVTKEAYPLGIVELLVSYDDRLDFCRKLGEISLDKAGLMCVDQRVYILNDVGYLGYNFAGLVYDISRSETKRMARPSCTFYLVGKAEGRIYALERFHSNVLQYVDETDEWIHVSPMPRMQAEGAVNLNGTLYVIGQCGRNMAMQVYNPSSDSWNFVSPPTIKRHLLTSVVYHGKIFVLGGVYQREDYDESVVDWHGLVNRIEDEDLFNNPKFGPGSTHDLFGFEDEDDLDQRVFDPASVIVNNVLNDVRDDIDATNSHVRCAQEVEVYDPLRDEWSFYPNLPLRQFNLLDVAVVKDRLYAYDSHFNKRMVYWDGSGEWKFVKGRSFLKVISKYRMCSVEDENIVREVMRRNKAEDISEWKETGLENAA